MASHKPFLLTGLSLAALATTTPAHAQHDIRLFLGESGIEFIEEQAPAALPSVFEVPTIAKSFTCMDFVQSNTTVNMSIDNVDIEFPTQDRITLALDFAIAANGELFADDLYACFGSATCNDTMDLDKGTAFLDFDVTIVGGKPHVVAREVDFNVDPDDFDFVLDECGFTGTALTSAISFTEGWILDYLEGKIGTMAEDNFAPMLEQMLTGLSMDSNYMRASVEDLYFPNDGVSMTVDVGVAMPLAAAECMAEFDKGGPSRERGAAVPNIQTGDISDVNMALNFGLLNEAMYTVWRKGLLCFTDAHIAALGVEVDLSMAGTLLPGFPAGTEFSLEVMFTDYPRVRGEGTESASLVLELGGLDIKLHGDRPDGTRNTLHAELSVTTVATLGVNPANNAIYAQLEGATITHMQLKDERDATDDGFDVARIQQMVHQAILPKLLHEMGPIPLTGPVFAVSDYAVLLRSIATNQAYASAGVDLFKIPANDVGAPDTSISAPATGNAHDAIVRVSGNDAEIPSELLQYQVSVNGEARALSFVRDIKIGEAGYTKSYEVSVAAVDLAGNVDPSPATATIMVDGIVPFVVVDGSRTRSADEGPVEISWTMNDDTTVAEKLSVRVEVYSLPDPADVLSAKIIDTQELAPGTTTTIVNLENAGGVYRIEVHAMDEAGNDSRSSLLLSSASTGGCSAGGPSSPFGTLLMVLALGWLWRRREATA